MVGEDARSVVRKVASGLMEGSTMTELSGGWSR